MAMQVFSPISSQTIKRSREGQESMMESSPGPRSYSSDNLRGDFIGNHIKYSCDAPNKRGRLTSNLHDENSSPQPALQIQQFAAGGGTNPSSSFGFNPSISSSNQLLVANHLGNGKKHLDARVYPDGKRVKKQMRERDMEEEEDRDSINEFGEIEHEKIGAPSAQLYKHLESQVDILSEQVRNNKTEMALAKQTNIKLLEGLHKKEEEKKILSRGLSIADGKMKEMQSQLNSVGTMQAQAQQAQVLFQENVQLKEVLTRAAEHIQGLESTVHTLRECLDKGSSGMNSGMGGFGPPDVF